MPKLARFGSSKLQHYKVETINFPGLPGRALGLETLPRPVGAPAVQIDQNIARLGAFARADDAAVFQFIHDARGAAVAEAQAALQERDAGFLFAADDFDALLDDVFVFIDAASVRRSCWPAWKVADGFPFRSSAWPAWR